jgi:hypothetical protein
MVERDHEKQTAVCGLLRSKNGKTGSATGMQKRRMRGGTVEVAASQGYTVELRQERACRHTDWSVY